MRITRLFVLLALAALLAPPAVASRTGVWERNPHASPTATNTNAAGLLAALAPAADLDTSTAADSEIVDSPRFDLGDVVLADTAAADAEHFDLGSLTLVDLNLLRGPPPSYPETRVGGFELLPPFRVGASPSLSLWGRQACGFSCREVASDSRYDPWGLESGGAFGAIDRRDRGITNPIAGTIDPEAVAKEAAATAVEELSFVGIANGLTSSLLGYDFVRNEKVKGPLARVLAGVSVIPGIPATIRRIDQVPGLNGIAKVGGLGGARRTALAAGTPEHRTARWTEYQRRGGSWPQGRWDSVYDENMVRAARSNKAADAYQAQLGWGRREVTVDVEGVPRRLDIADVARRRGVEVKTGYQTATQENLWEIERDSILVQQGWEIQWRFEDRASEPLRKALDAAGIPHSFGR